MPGGSKQEPICYTIKICNNYCNYSPDNYNLSFSTKIYYTRSNDRDNKRIGSTIKKLLTYNSMMLAE